MKASHETSIVSVVIPNYNGGCHLEACLRSLLKQTYAALEIVVVDNASSDDSSRIVTRTIPDATLLRMTQNLGFAGAVNEGIREARGEWIAVLNNDTETEPGWISECMEAAARHPEASFLACKIFQFGSRGHIYGAGDCFMRAGIGYRRGQERLDCADYCAEEETFSACGCAALYRRSALEERGGFDERFFAYLEDVELGIRLQFSEHRGWYVPRAIVYHHGGATSGGEFSPLAVRLRTRNALLLILKSLPTRIVGRCITRIAFSQLFWLARVLAHGRLWSYIRGLLGVIPLLTAMLDARKTLKRVGRGPAEHLWEAILRSEALARKDVKGFPPDRASIFLKWYFRLF